jgi:putative oxidoreductase
MQDISMNTASLSKYRPYVLSVLRIVSALIFMLHGTQKLFAFPAGRSPGTVDLFSMMGVAGVLEVFGGALLLIGLFTRPVAFVLSGLMACAYWMAHAPASLYPVNNGGDAAILYCFVFLYFVFSGPGPISVDAARGKSA